MKKYAFVFGCLFLFLGLSSCSKKDDNSITIEGKWAVSSEHYKVYTDNVLTVDTTITASDVVYFEFLNDGTLKETDEDGSIYTYTYSYNDNSKTLTTEEDGFTYDYHVNTLTQSELVLYSEESETYDDVTSKYTTEVTLERQ